MKFYPRSFNMGLSASLAKKIGGFSYLRHGQDIEYSNRIIKSGAKVIYINDAIVYHKRRTSIKKFFMQVFNWGVARIQLRKIDKDMLRLIHCLPAIVTLLSPIIWPIGLVIVLISGIHAAVSYRSFAMLYYVPVVMPTQIIGYGLGFLYALLFYKKKLVGFKC